MVIWFVKKMIMRVLGSGPWADVWNSVSAGPRHDPLFPPRQAKCCPDPNQQGGAWGS